MLTIDGSYGEGGGQILRTSLALAIVTEQPIVIKNIRAKRDKPGLRRQHLMSVRAAAEISGAELSGDKLGSRELRFKPAATRPGNYKFDIGTAGSTTLVLQTILPPLLLVKHCSTIELIGGTHNPFAPPFDFLKRVFLPMINRMGPSVTLDLKRPGFYPAGGGVLQVGIESAGCLAGLEIIERGKILRRLCRATVANLPDHISQRELATVARLLDWPEECLEARRYEERKLGPGNVVSIEIECEHVTEVFTGFGRRGVPAEAVAGEVAEEAKRYLEADVPVSEHLADQLLLPLALAGGGAYLTSRPTDHTKTNIEILRKFLDVPIELECQSDGRWRVVLG
jgi:RNA 3'-terminal phosphate cyclase (ATP)